jgi:hypothetical protein
MNSQQGTPQKLSSPVVSTSVSPSSPRLTSYKKASHSKVWLDKVASPRFITPESSPKVEFYFCPPITVNEITHSLERKIKMDSAYNY